MCLCLVATYGRTCLSIVPNTACAGTEVKSSCHLSKSLRVMVPSLRSPLLSLKVRTCLSSRLPVRAFKSMARSCFSHSDSARPCCRGSPALDEVDDCDAPMMSVLSASCMC